MGNKKRYILFSWKREDSYFRGWEALDGWFDTIKQIFIYLESNNLCYSYEIVDWQIVDTSTWEIIEEGAYDY